ncbi:Transcriptional regulator, MarR family [Sulfitobacter noctilucicola]|uniref:DNA-binding MarR family transcriptional regulator n=1 Tax=Sulfitobacter noctilucicola TaxID=1342301 RepID=A0A7W6Q3V9_9RHOB|nr:MarR family transcriptional regulator [Sulfitobacter noctilucicola]KIN63872.1 Transcriptional regulator, MarR family [Sulfitobacter noctilucicola]MBB4174620.1 DNA-binding MarR family transcriptional regulator [Sulfitobacter noctilucicola]
MNRAEKVDTSPARLGEMGLENFAPYLMNRIIGRYNAAMSSEMAALGLTTPQMRSLAVLSVIDGILIRELAVYAVVQQSTLSRALDTLDQNGLIRREQDEQDSRATRVFITDAGRDVYERLWPHMSEAYEAMFKGIDSAEKRAFIGTLQTILRNIRKHDF